MSENVVIAVDVLGGDFGPRVVLPGIEQALEEDPNLEVIACGPEDIVVPFADAHDRKCCAKEKGFQLSCRKSSG